MEPAAWVTPIPPRIPTNGVSAEKTSTGQQSNNQTNKSSNLAILPEEVWEVIVGNLPAANTINVRVVNKQLLGAIQLPKSIDVLQTLWRYIGGHPVRSEDLAAYMLRYRNSKLNIDIIINRETDLEAILAGRVEIPPGARINKLAIRCDIDRQKIRELLAKFASIDELCVNLDYLSVPSLTAIVCSIEGKKIKHLEVQDSFNKQKVKQLIEAIKASEEMQHNLASPSLAKLSLDASNCHLSDILPIANFTHNVKSLFLHFTGYGNRQCLETLSVMLPKLTDLTIHNLVIEPYEDNLLLAIFSAGKQLESLDMEISEMGAYNFLKALREDSYQQLVLPQLQELKVKYEFSDQGAGLSMMIGVAPKLKKFVVHASCYGVDYQRIFVTKDNLPIKDLDLYSLSKIGLPGLVFICKACPRLRTLKLPPMEDNFFGRYDLLDEASQKILQNSSAKLRDLSCAMNSDNPTGLIKFISLCENLNCLNLGIHLSCFNDINYLQFIEAICHNPALQNILVNLDQVVLDARGLESSALNKFIGFLKDGVVLELQHLEISRAELATRNGAVKVKCPLWSG